MEARTSRAAIRTPTVTSTAASTRAASIPAASTCLTCTSISSAETDEEVKKELVSQHEAYEQFSAKAAMLAKDRNIELKEPNPFKKAMMWGSIKMNTLTDNSRAHIAEMMIQGTVMGITSLRTSATEASAKADETDEIIALLNEMIEREEIFEKRWKKYL